MACKTDSEPVKATSHFSAKHIRKVASALSMEDKAAAVHPTQALFTRTYHQTHSHLPAPRPDRWTNSIAQFLVPRRKPKKRLQNCPCKAQIQFLSSSQIFCPICMFFNIPEFLKKASPPPGSRILLHFSFCYVWNRSRDKKRLEMQASAQFLISISQNTVGGAPP